MNNPFHPFSIARLPRIEYGSSTFNRTAQITSRFGKRALLVTGARSFTESEYWQQLLDQFVSNGISYEHVRVETEPSPQRVDKIVSEYATANIDVVVGIGGGSAMDAAKAIAGLLKVNQSVMDFLEGVGPELEYKGPTTPFIAVPTTAGTGSEATKNAVLSQLGKTGFKKSFRDEKLVAEVAIVDPDLLSTCPQAVIAANGMDALTQLIESYVSSKANIFNDALAISGLQAVRDGLLPLYQSAGSDAEARQRMAYASLISGVNLAQTGLGSVHGLASPLGAFYPIPHGVVCGTLVSTATQINVTSMLQREPDNPALERYARVSEILFARHLKSRDEALQQLTDLLEDWTQELQLERLSNYGVTASDLDRIVANSRGGSMRTNPIVLTDEEIKSILVQRL